MKQVKKLMAVMVVLGLVLSAPVASFGSIGELPVSLKVNGKLVASDLEPVKINNRTIYLYVQLRLLWVLR